MSFVMGLGILILVIFIYRYPLMNLVAVHSIHCSHKILSQATSPDGQYIATVFERNCGAVTPYTRVVSIRRRQSAFDGEDDRSWVFVMKDQPTIQIGWPAQWQLRIAAEGYSRTPREQRLKTARWENVQIVQ